MNGHPRDQAKVSIHCRWPLIRGNLTLKYVGRGIDNVAIQGRWPLTTGVAQGRYYCTCMRMTVLIYTNPEGLEKLGTGTESIVLPTVVQTFKQRSWNSTNDKKIQTLLLICYRQYTRRASFEYLGTMFTTNGAGFIQHSCHKIQGLFKVLLFFSRLNRIGKTLDLLRNACRSKHTFIGWRIM